MKKIIKLLFVFILVFLFIPVNAKESKDITLYFFHGDGCPHCAEEEIFLKKLDKEYDINIVEYEVWYNTENQELLDKVKNVYGINRNGVPLTIIGNTYFIGYRDSMSNTIKRAIDFYTQNDYADQVSLIRDGNTDIEIIDEFSKEEEESDADLSLDVPLAGNINLKNVSIASAAVLIGLIDGFNPCAMWVLLFLISILIGMKNRKRMWALGLAFLITSAAVYMLIMFSWLNIVVSISTSINIQRIIGIIAIIGGIINLRGFIKSNDSGCEVVDDKKRKKIFKQIRQFTSEKSFLLALLGVMALAVSVNLVELACSAGLPIVFTQLLAINNISGFEGFMYTLLYIFFFLIDDLIVFFIAMFTMNVTGISTKYNKYSHLIGGILMLLIGILLLIKPEILMFNF